jgi:hypothetical protein
VVFKHGRCYCRPMSSPAELLAAGTRVVVDARLDAVDWPAVEQALWDRGYAKLPAILAPATCEALVAMYQDEARFRSRVDMERFRFGVGDYKYFARPLPPVVETLRARLYPALVPVANAWQQALGNRRRFPSSLPELVALCARHGQTRPTPLLLHYETGGYNCLHQDLYGEIAFPLQVTCFLSRRNADYEGGEFLLVEQRPRAQSRGEALTFEQGEALVFATNHRPARGARGFYRVTMRHGVSTIQRGTRYTLGIIFHDAK